jgi:hypothetical protein
MFHVAVKKQLLYGVLFLLPLCLFAQDGGRKATALIPFWGSDQNIIAEFGEELVIGVDGMSEYSPWPVDMRPENLPADVPEGGFPPYICPSPSLTRTAPYALTGEVLFDEDSDMWSLRLYLWQMEDTRLIFSDEMTAYDREHLGENLPAMLEWLFSWIPGPTEEQPPIIVEGGGQSRVVYFSATEPLKWLYAGGRIGTAVRINTKPYWTGYDDSYNGTFFPNLQVALHANVQLFNALGVQAEIMMNMDSEPVNALSFIIPVMVRYSHRIGTMVISGFGGAYINLPIGDFSKNFEYTSKVPLGLTAGMNLGNKLGPGYAFLDVRWMGDLTYTISGNRGYRRNMIGVTVGYEIGFFLKK